MPTKMSKQINRMRSFPLDGSQQQTLAPEVGSNLKRNTREHKHSLTKGETTLRIQDVHAWRIMPPQEWFILDEHYNTADLVEMYAGELDYVSRSDNLA